MKGKIKKIIRIILISLAVCRAAYLLMEFAMLIFDIYLPIKMTYLGSAKGNKSELFDEPSFWLNFRYLYCGEGYYCFLTQEEYEFEDNIQNCHFHDFDFDLEIKAGKMYIFSYGVPLKKMEYCKGHVTEIGHHYYNRAVFDKEDFEEGIYYFYEIDDVGIGSMMSEDMYWFEATHYEGIELKFP